ncbi:MAX dimerization protein MGA a isoform X2 [Astyanax mexicanus]|uniref:MAX dimerization protein MGA a isoform X2 n=1 Tax=Astyanax mexicanus TaxID=7994 RepID=UPI0020CAF183|nr:MAX dimerization protein MGA a isoform X2 [Astyanax mexicanus]
MAVPDKQAIMVIHQEGMTTSGLAPKASSPRSLFVVLKPLHAGGGGQDEGALLANNNGTSLGTPTVGFQRLSSISLSAMADTNNSNQLWNLPAEITCKGVTVTLDNNNMWNEFYRCKTEMILTKQGRRMFPCCRFRISGLEPFQNYTLVMDMHPVDNHRYKWSDRRWETNGKGDPHIARSFVHPESPATGLDWMQNPVSFYKLKLTNNPLDQENHIVINSMHRYLPRLHIIPADKTTDGIQLDGPDIITFSFPQTEFFAVTAYQNLSITQLKIDYNPFAKGFREDSNNSRSSKPKIGLPTETVESEVKPSRETTTLNNLKTLFAKRNAAEKALKVQPLPVPAEDLKAVSADPPTMPEPKSASKKRPLAEGLSELIKGAHVKVKRISLEKIHDGSDQQTNTIVLPGAEKKKDSAADCGEKENLPITTADKVMEDKKKLKNDCGIPDVKSVTVAEGQMNINAVSSLKVADLATMKSTAELSCSKSTAQMNASVKKSDAPINDKVDTGLSETVEKTECKETLQTSGKPLDGGGEVKKKRAEPVPLPLLALFLQQLKSKTRPVRSKSKCETSASESEQLRKIPSDAEITSSPAASLTTTQSNTQPAAPTTSETSSILTCPVANSGVSACSSLSPTTAFFTSLTTSPTIPDMPTSLSPASLVVTDPEQDQGPDSDLEHKESPTLSSESNIATVPTSNITSDTVLDYKQEDASVILSSLSDNTVPERTLSSTTLDTDAVSSDVPCPLSPACSPPEIIPVSLFHSLQNDDVCNNVSTSVSTAEHTLDSCTLPSAEFVPEAPNQSPMSEDNDVDLAFSPSSPTFSIPSPAPSSPDPFPPGLFIDRPIPPRKSLDPFPPCLNRPRPHVDIMNAVPSSFSVAKPGCPGDLDLRFTTGVTTELPSPMPCSEPWVSKDAKQPQQPVHESVSKKPKVKNRKGGKLKLSDDAVTGGTIPVPMQPSLEDVEGQLFVSFVSKKALEIHLGDEAKEDATEKTAEHVDVNENNEKHQSIEERIDELEKILLRDLKEVKHRQVIHPVLQAVGLKLNLLDLALAIDLQYLGVLPIPPPVVVPGESSGSLASSQLPFVSRTGKTTDFTKIKGWRDKFSTSSSSSVPGGTSSETGQKNLSAFCSDMLDEYLESEGKLIDERVASLSQAVVPPVAYELPTKSTSYVRTLDSVLKKQATPSTATTVKPFVPSRKSPLTAKGKELGKSGEAASKQSFRSSAAKTASSPSFSKRFTKPGTSTPVSPDKSPLFSLSPSKKSRITKIKTRKGSKTSPPSARLEGRAALNSVSVPAEAQDSTSGSPGSVAGGRFPKSVAKLLDVEDGAVWEGKRRTYITEERAAIALSSLVTTEGKIKGNLSTIIKRRAPPCLNSFCRLGCVCASLAQERRQHHCGKPQCMLGCDCLRRKVVLLRKPYRTENTNEGALSVYEPDEKEAEMMRKKKKKKAYIMSGPEEAPEPATRVKRLWDDVKSDPDLECLFTPMPARPHCPPVLSPELQKDLDKFLRSPPRKTKHEEALSPIRGRKRRLMTCARVRPFCRKTPAIADHQSTKSDPHPVAEDSVEEMEEGELRPPALFGPTKRLEIVSQCKWSTEGSRNVVLRVVCERMAQDRLKDPFWVGKYQIKPISTTVNETEEGSTITYKISISQPSPLNNTQKKNEENEKMKRLEAQLIQTIGKSEVKGLPLLSHVTPAGLLKAEKKPPGASGQITVNGKPYPQAKLELGQMGALHPANRLAAYITGRVCVANQNASKAVTPATILTTSATSPTTTITTTTTTTTSTSSLDTTSSLSGTPSSAVISVNPTVTKPSVGTVFTQVVINHVNKQQKLHNTSVPLSLSTVKHIIKPSSSSMTGVTGVPVSSNMPPNASVSFQAPAASGLTDGAASGKKTVVITAGPSNTVTPGGGVRLMQPVTSSQPSAPGQKMVFQMYKTANGSTLYRNPSGQLIQLVPLNQFRALNPNVMLSKQTTIVRFPSATATKPQNNSSSTVTTSTPATSSTPLKAQNPTPVHSTSTVVHNSTTANMTKIITASSVGQKTATSLSGANSDQHSTVSIVPGILGNPGIGIIKVVPQAIIKDPKNPKITVTTSSPSAQSTSNVGPKNGGFILLSSLAQQNQGSLEIKDVSGVHTSPAPAGGSQQNNQSFNSSEKPAESVVLEDHCYTFEAKKTSIFSDKPANVPKEGTNSAEACFQSMIPEDVLDFAPIEDDDGSDLDAVLDPETVAKSNAELDLEDSDSELTEDSDMYDDSNSNNTSDQENLFIDTDSDGGEKKERRSKRKSVTSYMHDFNEMEDNDLVDIETYEENSETSEQRAQRERKMYLRRKQRVEQEMERRSCLRECFQKLHMSLSNVDSKSSRMTLLKLAWKEIQTLSKEAEELVKVKKELKKKRAYYLKMASQFSGKSKESISQKLSEIIAKQKALENQEKAKATTQPDPKPTLTDEQKRLGIKNKMKDTLHRHVQLSPNSRPMDLRTSRQKRLGSQDVEHLGARQNVSVAQKKGKKTIFRPIQPAKTLNPDTTSQPTPRERTRPNILSRSKSQSLPVSPSKNQVFVPQVMVETLPCNQIITISNPLQPIGITSLGKRQSATPGVAAVSISVPAISHPIKVENPIPVLQPQDIGLSNSPVKISSPGKTEIFPKISNVVSLVPPEKLVVTPSVVIEKTVPLVETHAALNPVCVEAQENTLLESTKGASAVEEQGLDKQTLEVLPKRPEQGTTVIQTDASARQKEERKDGASSEAEVENLMSLLDELEFLNQQLNSEPSQPQTGDLSNTKASNLPTNVFIEKEAGVDRDDERSLSPLFLRLDEDLMSSTPSKDELDDIPPKVDDLVKVIFGSDSPPNSSESEVTAGVNDDSSHGPACRVKSDAPSLPPLLQMKAGGGTTTDTLKEQAGVSWRPMPKLAPLGLKPQESTQHKTVSAHGTKPGSQLPSLRSAHM